MWHRRVRDQEAQASRPCQTQDVFQSAREGPVGCWEPQAEFRMGFGNETMMVMKRKGDLLFGARSIFLSRFESVFRF